MSLTSEELKMYGGSDAAAIANMSVYRKPIDVFARVTGLRVEEEDSDPLFIGTELEPFVRKFAIRKFGWKSLGPQKLRGVIRPYMRANLDDILEVDGERMLGEYKTANEWTVRLYGPTETDEFPVDHHCQTQFYFRAKPEIERGWLVAFLGGLELRRYPLRRDDDMGRALVEIVDRFHTDHVLKGIPPPLENDDSTVRWLRERYPRHNGTMLPSTPAIDAVAEQLRIARDALELAKAQEKEARIELEKFIQDADGVIGNGWKVLFRANKDGTKTDHEAIVRELGVPEELIQKHTRPSKGPRVFRPTFSQEK